MTKKSTHGGAREGSGPKKKKGEAYMMIKVPETLTADGVKEKVRDFAEKAVLKEFKNIL
jgi:hypothetical protein